MTEITGGQTRLITKEDACEFYKPAEPGLAGHMGIEVEMALYRQGREGRAEIPNPTTMDSIKNMLHDRGQPAQLEVAGVIEYGSPAMKVAETGKLIDKVFSDLEVYEEVASEHGFRRSPFSVLPTTTAAKARENITNRPRLHAVVGSCIAFGGEEAAQYHLFTTSVQASFSPKDADEMFRMTYRGYALGPLLIASMDNSSGYMADSPARHDSQHRMALLEKSPGGGMAPSFLKSSTPEEHVRNHIDAVFGNRMLFAYGHDGEILMPRPEKPFTFGDLAERGLNTQTNYLLAQTFLYPDMKICNLTNKDGEIVGLRAEVRPADSGYHQPASVALITAPLVPDGPSASKFDALLKDYGFTGNPVADAPLFTASRAAAVHHGGKFMDVAFGTGRLRDFAADVAGILADHYEGQKVGRHLSHLTEILLTGESDAQKHARNFGGLDEVKAFLLAANGNTPAVHAAPQRTAVAQFALRAGGL